MNSKTVWQLKRLKKVIPALVEGKFLRKTGAFLKSFFKGIIPSIDRRLGIIAKFFISISTPVQNNKVMFVTFQGDYTCNPKYISEQLSAMDENIEIVWSSRRTNLSHYDSFPPNVHVVEQYTMAFYEELASAKVWVVNSVDFLKNPIHKKPEQFLIETWHGSLGIKKFDKNSNSGRRWVEAAELCGKIADFCVSNSVFENGVYRETFWPKTEILEYGHPRNDILIPENKGKRDEIKARLSKKLHINEDTRVILYAPTFRDSKTFSCYDIDYELLLETLHAKFGGKWEVLVRFHPTVRRYNKGKLFMNKELVIDVTDYPDIQEIMAITDVAITDYSSWIYDYMLLRKPGFIYATDIWDYNSERGFYFKLETTPFPIATCNEELMENVLNFNEEKYKEQVELFLKDKGCFETGTASKRVAKKIAEIINSETPAKNNVLSTE